MGGVGYFTRDNTNIFYFPATINDYSGQIIAELRTKNTQDTYTLGGNFNIGGNKVFGAYLNRPINLALLDFASNYSINIDNVEISNTTDLFLGMPFGDWSLGGRLSVAFDSYKQDSTGFTNGDEESASYINLGLGASNENTDVGVYFEMPHAKSTEDNGQEDKISGTGFGIAARTFMGEKTKFVPMGLLNFGSAKYEHTVANVTSKIDFSSMNLALGAGINYDIRENAMLVVAVEALGISKVKSDIDGGTETTITVTDLPGIYMGAESQINKWLTGRLGAVQVMQKVVTKMKPQAGSETEESARQKEFHLTFGIGIAVGDFDLDLSLNEGLLFDGPNFISGTTETISDKISITYEF